MNRIYCFATEFSKVLLKHLSSDIISILKCGNFWVAYWPCPTFSGTRRAVLAQNSWYTFHFQQIKELTHPTDLILIWNENCYLYVLEACAVWFLWNCSLESGCCFDLWYLQYGCQHSRMLSEAWDCISGTIWWMWNFRNICTCFASLSLVVSNNQKIGRQKACLGFWRRTSCAI